MTGEYLRTKRGFCICNFINGSRKDCVLFYSPGRNAVLICDSIRSSMARSVHTYPGTVALTGKRSLRQRILIEPAWIFNLGYKLFRVILLANQIFPCSLRKVPTAKLIGADPCDGFFAAIKVYLRHRKGNTVPHTDLIAIVAVDQRPAPDNERVAAAIGQEIFFKLQVFCPLQQGNQIFELGINDERFRHLHNDTNSCLSTRCNVSSGNTATRFEEMTLPCRR